MAVTIRDIARQLGLSHTTVSLMLNHRRDISLSEETREEIVIQPQLAIRESSDGASSHV